MTSAAHRPKRVVVLGALSTIAEALCRLLATERAELVIAGRNERDLLAVAQDLRTRGASQVVPRVIDLAATENAGEALDDMVAALGGRVDAIVIIYGYLGDQRTAETDPAELERIIATNFTSAARWCVAAGNVAARQGEGVVMAVSSVAGDRGRQSNYVYGAAKAGLSVLMQGLAHRLAPTGARAVTVKLGFVDTAMTAHLEKGGPLWATPERVAAGLLRILNQPGRPLVYLPWFWAPIMRVIRSLPAPVIHKTKL